MLTGNLVRVRRRAGALLPLYLRGEARARALPIAEAMIGVVSGMVGETRDDLDAALAAVEVPARDRVVGLGLRKLLEDRCAFDVAAELDPEALRSDVFLAAAAAHRALGVRDGFDRDGVLAAVAAARGTTAAALDAGLYADLRGSELLGSFRGIGAEALLARYDVALAQAVLLRATRVEVTLAAEQAGGGRAARAPARVRDLFRAVRFHGLLHVVTADPAGGYHIVLDGPFSLWDAVQRYGLRLAMFLPSLLACGSFQLRADVLWGKQREAATFTLAAAEGLAGERGDAPGGLSPELDAFTEAFRELGSRWSVTQNDRIFALPGEVVCVPDLRFESAETGEEVFLEAFGFWSRAAVWKRVELLEKGFPARILLAVGKQLRVSEEVLSEDAAGELYVYGARMSPRGVLERLERGRPRKRAPRV